MKNANKISAVYFLVEGFGDARLVKVGRTIDTERRLAELQTGNGRKVRYLGWIPGGSKEERAIQVAMSEFHERGEWYRLTDEVKVLIDGVCAQNRMRTDQIEAEDLEKALNATIAIVCKGKACVEL